MGCSSPDLACRGTGPGLASSVGESSPNGFFPQSHTFSLSPLRVSPWIARAGAGEANLLYLNFFQPSCFAGWCFGAASQWVPGCSQGAAAHPEPRWCQITHLRSRRIQTLVPPPEIAALAGVVAGG